VEHLVGPKSKQPQRRPAQVSRDPFAISRYENESPAEQCTILRHTATPADFTFAQALPALFLLGHASFAPRKPFLLGLRQQPGRLARPK
jgi:hypothetical protein